MLGLSPLGLIHTAISLLALAAGLVAFIRCHELSWSSGSGRAYVILTVLTALTGFGIFKHGKFGDAHWLGVATLVVTVVAWAAGRKGLAGRWSHYVETLGLQTTFFFHFIPAVAETLTRVPVAKPIAATQTDPLVQGAIAVCFVWFLVGVVLQVRRLHARAAASV